MSVANIGPKNGVESLIEIWMLHVFVAVSREPLAQNQRAACS